MTTANTRHDIALSEQDGIRYLHFGTRWVQGAMRVSRPDQLVLAYVRDMMAWLLLLDPPARILQLGLGAGSLTRWCLAHLPESSVTVVERSSGVIDTCRSAFALPPDGPRLRVLRADAGRALTRPALHGAFGVVQVDLYDEHARGPVLDSTPFYAACHRALAPVGIMTVNLFGHEASFARSERRVRALFDDVFVLTPSEAGNTVLVALKGPGPFRGERPVTRAMLRARAAWLRARHGLPAGPWADAIATQAAARAGAGTVGK